MLRYHMAVVTRDNALKREVKRVTASTGSTADFVGDPAGLASENKIDLAIFDARRKDPDKQLLSRLPEDGRIIYVLEGDSLLSKLHLLKDERTTSLLCHDARFDDDEFIASATKALRAEIFGLQKYFPWGVTTFSMVIKSYEEKNRAIDILLRYAQLAGIRGPVRDRIQLVCDELMMNALYHAPVDAEGKELYRDRSLKELAQLPEVAPIQVQYGSSGRYFGVSVRDGGGSLTRQRALEYLMRARSGSHIETKSTGAGLGLISVLRSVSKLVFNLQPGDSTEVIALFDMELFAKGKIGARSLHVFTAPPEEPEEDEDDAEQQPHAYDDLSNVRLSGGSNNGTWALAAVLLVLVSIMGTAYYMKHLARVDAAEAAPAQAAPAPSVTVVTEPADAAVTLGGRPIESGSPVEVPAGAGDLTLRVERKGFKPWTKTIPRGEVGGDLRLFVSLQPGG
jgi:hypothetical protein